MKKWIGFIGVMVLFSCSPNEQLLHENEELKAEIEELRNEVEAMKSLAKRSAEEAYSQQQLAEAAMRAAVIEAERLAEQLKNCQ